MLPNANRFRDLRRSTLSWCRRTRVSASNAARDRNSPIKAHQINPQRSLIGNEYQPIRGRGQPTWVCGRDTGGRTISRSQLQFHYVDQCDGGRNAFRRISLTSAIMTRTGKLTTCSPCSSWRHTGIIIAVSSRPCGGSNSLIPRTVDNKPIREIRCPLCTIANCPTRRGQYCYASIGPTPQRRRRSKPAHNRSSGRLWGLCSRRDNHDLCPGIASPSSSMPAQDFGRCDGYHRMVDCIRAPKPRGFPPQSYRAGRAYPPCPHKNATLEPVITNQAEPLCPFVMPAFVGMCEVAHSTPK